MVISDPSSESDVLAVLRLKLGEMPAPVLVASCMMGCDCSCCFVML